MRHLILASIVSFPLAAWAQVQPTAATVLTKSPEESAPPSAIHIFTVGFAIGGDKLATREDNQTLDAGDGVYFTIGRLFANANPRLFTQLEFGLKFDSLTGANGEASLRRLPLTAMAFYSFDPIRIGFGPTLHLSPVYDLELAGRRDRVTFDNAFGLAAQLDYQLNQYFVGIRAEVINYHDSPGTAFIEGDSVGLHFGNEF